MNEMKSYKWHGCEIVPLKKAEGGGSEHSLMLLDMQADFSEFLDEEKNIIGNEKIVNEEGGGTFNMHKNHFLQRERKKRNSTNEKEKYVYEIDHLWGYMEWHYNFEDEIKVQKNLVENINKLRKIPKLYVSAHIIEGAVNEMSKNENICILKYTTYPSFYQKYNKDLDKLKESSGKNSIYNVCNYIYEVCDIADKSLVFANSPVINTTMRNILSITKSGKKREDFNEAEDLECISEDEIWQIYLSKKIKCINDQWLLICINHELKNIIKYSGDIYFKIFNKYIKEYNDFLKSYNYNSTVGREDIHRAVSSTSRNSTNKGYMASINSSSSNSNIRGGDNCAYITNTRHNAFEVNCTSNNLNLEKLKKYKVNLIFSDNKDINHILYKLCLNMGKFNDAVLCTKNKTFNILMNDIDGTIAICLKSFLSKYYGCGDRGAQWDGINEGVKAENGVSGTSGTHTVHDDEELVKTLSIMGLCKEKIVLTEKATIFSNVELLFSYYMIVDRESLYRAEDSTKRSGNNHNNNNSYCDGEEEEEEEQKDDDGVIYISKKALFENLQFSNEEISSYLLHLQKYSTNNLLYIKNKGFRYVKSEIICEFLIKIIELISINDSLYEYQNIEKGKGMKNMLFQKYQQDLHKVIKKKKSGISLLNIINLIYENINDFSFLKKNKIAIEPYIILQLCWKCCDIENKHFEYFTIYYNYYFFYEYLNKQSEDLSYEDIFENYLEFLENDEYINDTIVYINLFKLHNVMALNILRSSGKVVIHSEKLFTFDMEMYTYVKYIDEIFRSFNSNLMDIIIQDFIRSYQFFLDFGYEKGKHNSKENFTPGKEGLVGEEKDVKGRKSGNYNEYNNDNDDDVDHVGQSSNQKLSNGDIYKNRVLFRNNIILGVNNINHICNDNYMFEYFIVVKYYYSENNFALLEKRLKKFIKTVEEDFMNTQLISSGGGGNITDDTNTSAYDMNKNYRSNLDKLKSNYCLNYKIFKYQTTSFPHIRLTNNYNDLLKFVYTPLSIHCSIFHENVIYNKKRKIFQLIPSFLLKDNLRSCLTALFTFKTSYYAQEFYPFLNPLLNNKDLIGTIAVPPLRHCRTKLIEKENKKNIEFLEVGNIVFSSLNKDIRNYSKSTEHKKKFIEKLCKLYNCNLPVNNFSA
ncbi:hypothetical protein MKS88_001339 [Plasmodium brasilianum]|uniref:Uncharacterized protein n=1 Tax=Plasmodium brasilianum TaxID=5824 RepID=A0ACB9YCH9_PLABR|nr:hypothetical protein MKS88_001339 [Plasmodium brasilianum]